MKNLKNLKSIALAVIVGLTAFSCVDNKDFDMPSIKVKEAVEIEASTADVSVYEVGKYVKMHGNISVDGKWAYFILKDGTKIQIYGATREASESLSEEQKKKLATDGQELTVTGVFKDFKLKNGTVVKEIVYESAEDLVFGDGVVAPPKEDAIKLDASTAKMKDYDDNEGKKVELHGKVVVKEVNGKKRSYFRFSDGSEIQIYVKDFNDMPNGDKDKLNTEGQEITIVGTFKAFKGTKQIQCVSKDITFGKKSDDNTGVDPAPTPAPAPSTGNIFDFENLEEIKNNYGVTGELTATDGTVLKFEARTDLDQYAIDGKGLMLKGKDKKSNTYININFKTDVKKVKFAYKAGYTGTEDRTIVIYKGGVDSTEKLDEKVFKYTESGEFEFDLKGAKEITIKVEGRRQVVIDNISWSTDGAGNVNPQPTPTPPAQGDILNAEDLKETDFEDHKKVTVKGKIVIENKTPYFVFGDGTKIIIYAWSNDYKELSDDAKTKLKTEGQEVTITGEFRDWNGKRLIFKKESDLVFGQGSVDSDALKASELTADDYKEGEKAKIYGKVIRESNKTFFELKDKTRLLVFAYTNEWKGISDENKKKLSTEGQYVTVDGVYKKFNNDYPMGLRFFKDEDLKFAN